MDEYYIVTLDYNDIYSKLGNIIDIYTLEIDYLYSIISIYSSLFLFGTVLGICICTMREPNNNYRQIENNESPTKKFTIKESKKDKKPIDV